MTIYVGEISHKPSADHLAGEIRHLEGATDNETLANAFGVSGHAGSFSSNGKVSLIDLFPNDKNGTIYADPSELTRVDDIDYINQHLNIIVDWAALVRYMFINHHSELQLALTDISTMVTLNSLTNEAQIAVAKYFFNVISRNDARQIIDNQDEDQRFQDEIGRNILGKNSHFNFELHGLIFNVGLKTSHYKLDKRQIGIDFKIEYANVNGSARQIKGENAKNQRTQFKFFKRQVMDLIGSDKIKTSFKHNYDPNNWTSEIINELNDKLQNDFESIKKQIKTYLAKLTPTDAGVNEFDDYNVATAINRLWYTLKLPVSEITTGNIDMNSVKKWYQKEISTAEFLQINHDVFVSKIQNALSSRFDEENVDFDAYINRALDYAKDDLRGFELTKLVSVAQKVAPQVVEDYADSFNSINNLDELMELYHASNRMHDQKIIENLSNKIIASVSQEDEIDPEIKNKIETTLSSKLLKLATERYQIFLQENYILLGSVFDQNLVKKYLTENLDQVTTRALAKSKLLNSNNLDDYLNQLLSNLTANIDEYYVEHFDVEIALNQAKDNIYDTLIKTIPYSKMQDNYWETILQRISSYKAIQPYQYADNVESFVSHFAPSFEDDLQNETKLSKQEVRDFFIPKSEQLFNENILKDLIQKLHDKLHVDNIDELDMQITLQIDDKIAIFSKRFESDFTEFINSFVIYPQTELNDVINTYVQEEKNKLLSEFDKLDWSDLKEQVKYSLDMKNENTQDIKNKLMLAFPHYIKDSNKGFPIVHSHLTNQLNQHGFKYGIQSVSQSQKIEQISDKLIASIISKFDSDVCSAKDISDIVDGYVTPDEYIRNYVNELDINAIINSLGIDWDILTELGRNEIIDDLIDDTGLSREKITQFVNERFPGEKINSILSNDYEELVIELKDSPELNDFEEWMNKNSLIRDYIYIFSHALPTSAQDINTVALKYPSIIEFIQDNIEEFINILQEEDMLDSYNSENEIIMLIQNKWTIDKIIKTIYPQAEYYDVYALYSIYKKGE